MEYEITISGGRGDNILAPEAGNEDSTHSISGGQGDDIITGGNLADLLDGGQDDDVLNGGAGDDDLRGGPGDDVLEGGSGDDILDAGPEHSGAQASRVYYEDTFVFNFTLSESEGTTYYFRPNDDNTGGDTPNSQANLQAWQNYMDQLEDWRAAMEAQYGTDADQTKTGEAVYTVKKTTGSLGEYDNSYTVSGGDLAITSSDGHDKIVNFWDNSKLELKGLAGISFENFDKLFNVAYDGTADNTVLSWSGGSITIHNLELADDAAFYEAATDKGWFVV